MFISILCVFSDTAKNKVLTLTKAEELTEWKSLTKAGMGIKYHGKDSCHMTSLAVHISSKNSC